uniref:Protein abrupt n=1 Tax=Cacopsylla melanoneura TaxID=428564 RepID=A0A8D8WV32_9HEMI
MDELVSPTDSTPSSCDHSDQLLELKWNNFQSILTNELSDLRYHEDLVDVTLVTGSQRLFAHKLVLCAASPWFKTLLTENPCNHPIILLNEEYHDHLANILNFIYSGYAHVPQLNLSEFLQLAQHLQIKGLADAAAQDEQHSNKGKPPTTNQTSDQQHCSYRRPSPTTNIGFDELHPELEISKRTKTRPHRTNSEPERNNSDSQRSNNTPQDRSNSSRLETNSHGSNSDQNINNSYPHRTNSGPHRTNSGPQRSNNSPENRNNSSRHQTNTNVSNSDLHRTNSPPHRSKCKQIIGQPVKIEQIQKRSSEYSGEQSENSVLPEHDGQLVPKKSRFDISDDNNSSPSSLERSAISTMDHSRSPEEEHRKDLDIPNNPHIDSSDQNIEPDPSEHPYTLLEPKLEILDEQVCYPEYGSDPNDMEQDYQGSHSTQHENQRPFYNEKHSLGRSQLHSSATSSSNHNSIQDLMNITGRLKEIQPIRTSVYDIPRPSLEPGTSMYNSSRGGCAEGPSQYLSSDYSSLTSSDTSIVPYMNKQPYQHDPSSTHPESPLFSFSSAASATKPLHSLDSRYCHLCGKHYSNSSNLKQHIRLIHLPGLLFCPLCGKSFKNKLYLRRHVISFHENA